MKRMTVRAERLTGHGVSLEPVQSLGEGLNQKRKAIPRPVDFDLSMVKTLEERRETIAMLTGLQVRATQMHQFGEAGLDQPLIPAPQESFLESIVDSF